MRIQRTTDFGRVYREGSRAKGSILIVAVRSNDSATTRVGLSVGRKASKSAVRRNRIKRIFREAFRLSYPELPRGLDVVLIAAGPGLDPSLEDTRRELVKLTNKAHRRFREKVASEGESA